MSETTPEAAGLTTSDEFMRLVAAANAGKAEALETLKALLNDRPEIWQRVGDLAAHTEALLIGVIAGDNKLLSESVRRKLGEMKSQLLGSSKSLLEQMAVERVLTAWLAVQYIDGVVAKSSGGTLPQSHFQLRRQDLAGKRLLAAIKMLADLRRLLPKSSNNVEGEAAISLKLFDGEPEIPLPATGSE